MREVFQSAAASVLSMLSPVVPQADGPGASSEQSVADPADSVQATPETPESVHTELAGLLRADGLEVTSYEHSVVDPKSSTNVSSGSALKDSTNDGDANSGRVLKSSTNISSGSALKDGTNDGGGSVSVGSGSVMKSSTNIRQMQRKIGQRLRGARGATWLERSASLTAGAILNSIAAIGGPC